jgi:DNA processing protein
LVESVEDILEEFSSPGGPLASRASPPEIPSPHSSHPVLQAMGFEPISLDALVERCGWSAAELNAQLFELEMLGELARLPGQLFQRRKRS